MDEKQLYFKQWEDLSLHSHGFLRTMQSNLKKIFKNKPLGSPTKEALTSLLLQCKS